MALKDWKKEKYNKNGGWFSLKSKKRISIGDKFAGVIHIFYNADRFQAPSGSHTIKVVKTRKQALKFAKQYMRKH